MVGRATSQNREVLGLRLERVTAAGTQDTARDATAVNGVNTNGPSLGFHCVVSQTRRCSF